MNNWYLALGAVAVIVAGYLSYKAWEKHKATKAVAGMAAAAMAAGAGPACPCQCGAPASHCKCAAGCPCRTKGPCPKA